MPELPPTSRLPPFLREPTMLEVEDIPLQVLLLTQEMAAIRLRLEMLGQTLTALGRALKPDRFELL